jgi:peptidoglycan/LPS O-acetylase OafA/YrhL
MFIMAVAFVIRLVLASFGFEIFYFTLCRMDTLVIGASIAILAAEPGGLEAIIAKLRRPYFWVPALAFVGCLVLSGMHGPLMQASKFVLIEFAYAAVLVLTLRAKRGDWRSRFLANRFFVNVARYSFAMYVVHPAVFEYFQLRYSTAPLFIEFLLASAVTYGVAALSWRILESPVASLKEKLAPRRAPVLEFKPSGVLYRG